MREKMVKVEIEVPDKIVAFLKDVTKLSDLDVDDYLRQCVVQQFTADLDHIAETPFWTPGALKAKYGLETEPDP